MSETWSPGFFVDEQWQFSDDAWPNILAALNAPPGKVHEAALACLLDRTQLNRGYRANESARPKKAVASKHMATLGAQAGALRRTLEALDVSAEEYLVHESAVIGSDLTATSLRAIAATLARVEVAALSFQPRGRRRDEALTI